MTKTRAAIYVRQSEDKTGEETAVERQEAACRLLAEAKGWQDPKLYRDNSISASSGKARPAFDQLVTDMETGQLDAVIVWHLDRLTRNIKDLQRVIEAGHDLRVNIACVHGVSLDLGDPTGVAVATILTAIAAMEVKHKGQRQRAANRQRASKGQSSWVRRPFGYERVEEGVHLVPAEAEALSAAADKVLSGATLASIARTWNETGLSTTTGKPWTVSTLRRALLNPRIAGRRMYNGADVATGNWPPILDADTHKRLEETLTDPRRRTAPDDLGAKYLLSGIATCGKCGKPMYASPARARGKETMVYRCFGGYCMSRSLRRVDLEVEAVIIGLLNRPDAARVLASDTDIQALRARADGLRERRDALAALLADGLLSPAAVREQAGRIGAELSNVTAAISSAEGLSPLLGIAGRDDAADRWLDLPIERRRRIIRDLAHVVILPAGKGVRFDSSQIQITSKG